MPSRNKKLSHDKITEIVGYVREGLPLDSVAALSDVGLQTLQGWLRRAKKEEEQDPLIYKLAWEVEKAHATFVRHNVEKVQEIGDSGNLSAVTFLLEKRDAKNFSKQKEEDDTPTRVIVVPEVMDVTSWVEKHGNKKEEADGPGEP